MFLSFYLSIGLSSICFHLSIYLLVFLSVFIICFSPFVYLSICLSVYLSIKTCSYGTLTKQETFLVLKKPHNQRSMSDQGEGY